MPTRNTESMRSHNAAGAHRIVTDEEFGDICDVIDRAWFNLPADSYKDDDGYLTSDYAREATRRVLDILGIAMPEIRMSASETAAIAAYRAKRRAL